MNSLGRFCSALAFLSRIIPPGFIPSIDLRHCILWFPPASLLISLLCTGCSALFCIVGLYKHFPFQLVALAGSWIWLAMELWLCRGLHWDGLSDLADALGSMAHGEKFWIIIKDSHMGSFGAMGILVVFTGQLLGGALHLSESFELSGQAGIIIRYYPLLTLLLSIVWSRLTPIWLGFSILPRKADSLGGQLCALITVRHWIISWLWAFAIVYLCCLGGLPYLQGLMLIFFQILLTALLRKLAIKHGGVNGDFFGAHIEFSQLLFIFLTL